MPAALTSSPNPAAAGASGGVLAWISAHRWPLVAILLAAAGVIALGVATYRPSWLPGRTGEAANRFATSVGQQAGNAAKSVASLFELRSPGERVAGALASLKGEKRPLLHERALPKVRRPISPLAAIVAAPPVPPVVPPEAPLDNVVAPKPVPAVGFTPAPGGPPVVFPGVISPPGGGGGVILPPPITTTPPPVTPVVPTTPNTPGVPEPGTWATMLLGFAMIGWTMRRRPARLATA